MVWFWWSKRPAVCSRVGPHLGRGWSIVAFCALVLLSATRASAQDSGWVIKTFDVQLAVQANSDVLVTEDIAVDFGSQRKHGIYRDIPVRNGYDATRERLIHIEDARVEGDPGTPADLAVMDMGPMVRLRIGSPSQTLSGAHRYRLTYRVVGVMNSFQTHEELYWNVTGSQWSVPIERASVRITGPAEVTRIACYRGPTGSREQCPQADTRTHQGRASTGSLEPGQGMTVVVAFPSGSVQVPPPELVTIPREPEHPTAHLGYSLKAQAPGTLDFVIALLLSGLIVAGLVWLYPRRVRDEPARERVRHGFEAQPPGGLRPALLSLLVHKRVGERDIAATLVDLAVRGYLSIEQQPRSWLFGGGNWLLTRRYRREGPDDPPLAEYERVLLASLFATGESVLTAELKGHFASEYKQVRELIYEAPEAEDWFSDRPDHVRTGWGLLALGMLFGGLLPTLAAWSVGRFDLAVRFAPLVPGGLVMGGLVLRMPRRTPEGSATLLRALDFRTFILTAEKRRAELSAQPQLFTELLPYAIALGVEDAWARVFSGLSTQALTRTPYGIWFVAAAGSTFLNASALSDAVSSFGSYVGGALSSTPASSGSSGFGGGGGFSGGGGGGGGGGGW